MEIPKADDVLSKLNQQNTSDINESCFQSIKPLAVNTLDIKFFKDIKNDC